MQREIQQEILRFHAHYVFFIRREGEIDPPPGDVPAHFGGILELEREERHDAAHAALLYLLARPQLVQDRGRFRIQAEVPGPRVVVVRDLDDPPGHGSLWGEVNATIFGALGCVGCVTDGCVRDLKEARAMGFQFFARGPGVSHAYVRVESAGQPVTVGGLRVSPGDLIHADQHGVLLIPREIAADLPAAAEHVIAAEQDLLRWVRSSEFDADELIARRRVKH